jgi:hypothetical protein
MDYTGSYKTFTYDQKERIQHVFEFRLWFNDLLNQIAMTNFNLTHAVK